MAEGPRYKVQFRRKREGKTDYRHRKKLLMSGLPRAVVRKSLRNVIVQCIEFTPQGDKVIASANALELKDYGWKGSFSNTSAAYLTGLLAGSRASRKGVNKAVLDIGMNSPAKGSKVFASLKGLLDAGLEIPHSEKVIPSAERLKGKDESLFNEVKGNLGRKQETKKNGRREVDG